MQAAACGPQPWGAQHQLEQRSAHRRRALTQTHEASTVGERGKLLRPRAVDNEATVPGQAPHDHGTALPGSLAGTCLGGE